MRTHLGYRALVFAPLMALLLAVPARAQQPTAKVARPAKAAPAAPKHVYVAPTK